MVATLLNKELHSSIEFKDEHGVEGEFEAVFSTFDVVDKDGDIVKASAITAGQEVPIFWSHDMFGMPIGIGTISKQADKAIINGHFIDSTAGQDARKTIKATQKFQELSWGFKVLKTHLDNVNGEPVRVIDETDTHEVSFVLRAAGEGTGIRDVKSSTRFTDQIKATQAVVEDLVKRTESLVELRAQEGRKISDEIADELSGFATVLLEAAGGIEDALGPGFDDAPSSSEQARAELQGLRARFYRVADPEGAVA